MFNPFKQAKAKISSTAMKMMQKSMQKKLEKMSPAERNKLMQEAFSQISKPENREKFLDAMEEMRKSGQITEEQYQIAKSRLGN